MKQVIVMRTDTKPPMRKGKMIVQGAHASLQFLMIESEDCDNLEGWASSGFKKVCVRVNSEEELFHIFSEAERRGLTVHMIQDFGLTEFTQPTYTCLAVGPNEDDKINEVTGHLELL